MMLYFIKNSWQIFVFSLIFFFSTNVWSQNTPLPFLLSAEETQFVPSAISRSDDLTKYRLEKLEQDSQQISQEVKRSEENTRGDIERLKERALLIETVGLVLTLLTTIAGIFGWAKIRNVALGSLKASIQPSIEKQFKESELKLTKQFEENNSSINKLLFDLANRANSELVNMMQFLTFHSLGKFDAALDAIGWEDINRLAVAKFPYLREQMIDCLLKSKIGNRKYIAWSLAKEHAQNATDSNSIQLILKAALRAEEFEDGLRIFEIIRSRTKIDTEVIRRAIPLFRRINKHREAIELLKTLPSKDRETILSVNALASLHRDLGHFEKANGILYPYATKIIESDRANLPPDWKYVINSFIACAIDRDRPSEAVKACELLVDMERSAVSLYTAVRLLTKLPKVHPNRDSGLKKIAHVLNEISPHHQAVMCRAMLCEDENRLEDAVNLMRDAVSRMEQNIQKIPSGGDLYFSRCLLGRLLRVHCDLPGSIRVLVDAANEKDTEGEAKYELALTYAAKGEKDSAFSWLRKAIETRNAWAIRARNNAVWANWNDVQQLLAWHSAKDSGINDAITES